MCAVLSSLCDGVCKMVKKKSVEIFDSMFSVILEFVPSSYLGIPCLCNNPTVCFATLHVSDTILEMGVKNMCTKVSSSCSN